MLLKACLQFRDLDVRVLALEACLLKVATPSGQSTLAEPTPFIEKLETAFEHTVTKLHLHQPAKSALQQNYSFMKVVKKILPAHFSTTPL